jgi:putative membrane protein
MRSTGWFGKLLPLAVCAAAAFAVGSGCTSSTAGGSAGAGMGGGGDGGMMSADGGMGGGMASGAMAMADAGAGMAHEAGQAMADAGASAYGAASSAASGAATTASEAASSAMDAGTAMASADMDAGSSGSSSASSGGGMTDPQIASVAVAANQVDIDAGKLAKSKSKNAKVKKFANDMIRDHGSAIKQAVALVTRLGVTPEENDTSKSITQGGKDNIANLKTLKGKAFDKAYAEHEVAYHQQVLDALDKTLIPDAQNADLKSLLQSVRAVIAQHLDHATALVDSLSK